MKPTITKTERVAVLLAGRAIPWGKLHVRALPNAKEMLEELSVSSVLLQHLVLPNDLESRGYQLVAHHPNKPGETHADGLILNQSGQAMTAATRDCISVIIVTADGNIGYLHGHRAGMVPNVSGHNLVDNLLFHLTKQEPVTSHWEAYLLGGICGDCFTHDPQHDHLSKLESISPNALTERADGTIGINLPKLIGEQLWRAGFSKEKIMHDGVCTFSDPRFGSKRREQEGPHNQIVVYKY